MNELNPATVFSIGVELQVLKCMGFHGFGGWVGSPSPQNFQGFFVIWGDFPSLSYSETIK